MNMPNWAEHIRPRLSSLRLSPTRENEIVDELSQHLDDRWRELIAGGASPDEATRLALADVNAAFNTFLMNRVAVGNNLTITPSMPPPTGIYSEDGIHPNSRGYAFIANIFIEAINEKFAASVPKADLRKYSATAMTASNANGISTMSPSKRV